MPRLFSGIELPPNIRETLSKMHQPLPSTRWIEPNDLHLTLRFAGDVTPPVGRELAENLANIAFEPFSVRITGLATFGGSDPRLLYAAIEPTVALTDLANANEMAARRAGLKPESRKFIPHITLARMQAPRIDPIARYLSRYGGFTTEPFWVSQFVLFSSKPTTGGGPYVVEQVCPSTAGNFEDIDWPTDESDHDHPR